MAVVLVVEDDLSFSKTMVRMLESGGHKVALVNLPDDDVMTIAMASNPDVAICDVWLGEMNGLTIAKELKESIPQLPVILMSGGGGNLPLETVTAIADMRGVTNVLYKPFAKETLLQAISSTLSAG